MTTKNIKTLNSTALRAVYSRHPIGEMAYTYACNIEWEEGKTSNAFVKRFQKENELGLVNEITGYILAKACSLPVPKYAALIQTSNNQFDIKDNSFISWSFATSALNGQTPQSLYDLGDITGCKTLLDHIASWKNIAKTIAFDDWIANEDRNLGNIVVEDKNNISLIDHSNIPINLSWKAEELNPLYIATNKLNQSLYNSKCPLPIKSKISEANSEHIECYQQVQDELTFWWDLLLMKDNERRKAIEFFIKERSILGNKRVNFDLRLLA